MTSTNFNGIIILSGDGLVSEVLNGLIEREDRTSIVPSIPIGIVPCGSGNALLASLFFSQNEPLSNPKFTKRAIEVCCSPGSSVQLVNLIHVQTDKENIAAFLSVGWGLIADIDIESERWRHSLGSHRFVVGSLIRTLNLRTYRGRLSYKPYVTGIQNVGKKYDVYGKTTKERMTHFSSHCHEERTTPSHRVLDAAWRSFQTEKVDDIENDVSDDWIHFEDEFITVYAVTLSHISTDAPFAPQARMNDDRIYLTYILHKDIPSRLSLIKFLSAIKTQKHLDMPFVKTVEVSAFRLEPLVSGSFIVVDGEVVEATKVQAVTSTLNMAVFAPQREREYD
ncbi:Sphingosine kinase 1 [Parelaphostrongylus tenuis]|uniref:Sphingosine kinase 1 n=1 Tax=Parelaphostrongylus tenuis TaxID=148309 RepID=A0AAD5MCH7_PARTN|nr:Sphingosine kinase 1 [Parelaphostrongylus tenuis]